MAPKINIEVVSERVTGLEKQLENQRADLQRIFAKLDEIHTGLKLMEARPSCPNPGACVAVNEELKIQRAALEAYNFRLGNLETDKRVLVGGKTLIFTICSVVGWAVLALIEWHKR